MSTCVRHKQIDWELGIHLIFYVSYIVLYICVCTRIITFHTYIDIYKHRRVCMYRLHFYICPLLS